MLRSNLYRSNLTFDNEISMFKLVVALLTVLLSIESHAQVRIQRDIPYCSTKEGRNLFADFYLPETDSNQTPAIILIHGGGWSGGSKAALEEHATLLAENGFAAVAVDYRLVSQSAGIRYDQQIADIKCAIRFTRARSESFNIDRRKLGIMGTSAGGHLALQAALEHSPHESVGEYPGVSDAVSAVVNWYGPADIISHSNYANNARDRLIALVGGEYTNLNDATLTKNQRFLNNRYKYISPAYHVDLYDPPILTIHGVLDRTVDPDISVRFDKTCKSLGLNHTLVLIPDAGHIFSPGTSHYHQAMASTTLFFNSKLR